ncbi:hypothetical protein D8674_019124 [Pyrus ussuriensis x Pyrus communis]|uniref:Uncharacterized protein n=1 Tax=Pyrus ussuriensis x Pyrus communis TaxID=2448454 RepID=A0A5N5GCC2_9ROSA|nr:hypothetical protein D8674_019124 [Pyrus ussuriensis x Pyrus communis]
MEEDKNRDESMLANPYDLRHHVELAHVIGVARRNNCSIAKWRSWKYVPEYVKKAGMDQLLLMKLVEEALKGGYKRWHYDVEQNGGPPKQ